MGIIADTLRASLRDLAQSDARLYRGLDKSLGNIKAGLAELATTQAIEPADCLNEQIDAAIALLEANGYTVTR